MQRIAIYYDNLCTGRNDGNPLYVWNDLKRRQAAGELEVDHLIPSPTVKNHGVYDTNVWVDWGEDGLGPLIRYPLIDCPKPNIYWASDTHLGFDYRLQMAKKFDHVFVAQHRAALEFAAAGVKAEWLPHAFEPEAYPTFEDLERRKLRDLNESVEAGQMFRRGEKLEIAQLSKKYDVCFVGHINSQNRIDFLDRMFSEFPNFFYGQRLFEEAAEKFHESKIVLNISMLDDLNMRTFEAMGTGSFLLTNWIPTIEDVFEDGKHLVLYKSIEEAVDKAKYYLAHDDEREKIAQAGYEEVMAKHQIKHRVDRMLSALHAEAMATN